MSELHIGPHTRKDPEVDPAAETFDREINVRAITWSVIILVVVALVAHLVVFGVIKGLNRAYDVRDPRPSPLPEANRQGPPPLPRLQTAPEGELQDFREKEDQALANIKEAMKVIAERGLGPEVVGGTPQAATAQTPQPGQTPPPQERR